MDLDRGNLENLSRLLGPEFVLGQLAVHKGYLTDLQLRELLEAASGPAAFEEALRDRGLLTSEQIRDLKADAERLDRQQRGGDAPSLVPDDPLRKLGRYTLVEEVGSGGAGVVWKAWDEQLARWVALKQPRFNRGVARDRFLREARAAARVQHPSLIAIHEIGAHEDRDYLVMEFVDGRSLDESPANDRVQASRLADVCEAVESMHLAGVLHRDLKPQNIIVDTAGKAHLGDFGVAKLVGDAPMTLEGTLLGTPQYMAPEQLARDSAAIGPATDVYGLGATLFHAFTGQPPHAGETALQSLIEKVGREGVPSPRSVRPDLPEDLDRIIRRAMAKDPSDRYGTAADLAEDLRRYSRGEPVLAHPPSPMRRGVRWFRRNPGLAAAVLIVVGVTSASLAGLLRMGSRVSDLVERRETFEDARRRGDELWLKAVGFTRATTIDREALARAAEGAFEYYREAGGTIPEDPYPWLMRGRCRNLLGRGDDAVADWTEALARNPNYGPALFERGKHYLSSFVDLRLPRRTQVGGGTVRFGPPDAVDEDRKRVRTRGREDLERARRAGDLEPASLEYLEGILLLGEAKFEEAAGRLEAYSKEYPWDAEALLLLGAARYHARRFEAAASAWSRAVELRPTPLHLRLLGDAQYCLSRFGDAVETYTAALAMEESDPVARCNRGLARQAMGRHADAIRDYDSVLAEHPRFARAYNARGSARFIQGKYDEAVEDFERALDLNEFFPEAHNNLGNARVMLAEIEPAITEYEIAISLDPEYVEAYLNRGEAYLLLGDAGRAGRDFEKAATLDPGNPDAHYRLARACRRQGDRKRAFRALTRALEVAPPDWPLRERARQLLQQLSGE